MLDCQSISVRIGSGAPEKMVALECRRFWEAQLDDIIQLLSSPPLYELLFFCAGMAAGYGIAYWQHLQNRKGRAARRMKAHARRGPAADASGRSEGSVALK